MPETLLLIEAGPPTDEVVRNALEKVGAELVKKGPGLQPPPGRLHTKGVNPGGHDRYLVALPWTDQEDFKEKVDYLQENAATGEKWIWTYQGPDPREKPWGLIALGAGIAGTVLGGYAVTQG